jgi:hypothetical protein
MAHDQPVPLALVGVSPDGTLSVTVTVLPLVAEEPPLVTVKVKVPVPPRVNVPALAVFDRVRSGPVTVVVALLQLVVEHDELGTAGLAPPPGSTDA